MNFLLNISINASYNLFEIEKKSAWIEISTKNSPSRQIWPIIVIFLAEYGRSVYLGKRLSRRPVDQSFKQEIFSPTGGRTAYWNGLCLADRR